MTSFQKIIIIATLLSNVPSSCSCVNTSTITNHHRKRNAVEAFSAPIRLGYSHPNSRHSRTTGIRYNRSRSRSTARIPIPIPIAISIQIPASSTIPIRHKQQSSTSTSTSTTLYSDVSDTLSAIDTFYQTAPYTSAFITCGIKASAADLLAQRREIRKDGEENESEDGDGGENAILDQMKVEFTPGRINAAFVQQMDQPGDGDVNGIGIQEVDIDSSSVINTHSNTISSKEQGQGHKQEQDQIVAMYNEISRIQSQSISSSESSHVDVSAPVPATTSAPIPTSVPYSVATSTLKILSSPEGQAAMEMEAFETISTRSLIENTSPSSSTITSSSSSSASSASSSSIPNNEKLDSSSFTSSSLPLPSTNTLPILPSSTTTSTSTSSSTLSFQLDRNVAFILYGGFYQGMAQQFIYNTLFPSMFGTSTDLVTVLMKVSFDLLVVSPFVCLPIAYITKAVIYNTSSGSESESRMEEALAVAAEYEMGTTSTSMDVSKLQSSNQPQLQEQPSSNILSFWTDSFAQAMDKYWYDIQYQNVLGKFWAIWLPAQCLTFSVVPDHLRIVFIAFVSFFWLILLSTISAATGDGEDEG